MGKKRDRESLGGDAAVPGGDPTSSMFTEVRANVSLKLLPVLISLPVHLGCLCSPLEKTVVEPLPGPCAAVRPPRAARAGSRQANALAQERISDVDAAVRKELSGMLLRLDPHLGGVPVTFSKVKILETTAPLFEDHPQILIDVAADFLLFAPQPGQTVTGVVNNVADDSLGLLILETFNAVIPFDQVCRAPPRAAAPRAPPAPPPPADRVRARAQLSKSFRYDAGAAAWVHGEDAEQRLELGLVLDFRCSEVRRGERCAPGWYGVGGDVRTVCTGWGKMCIRFVRGGGRCAYGLHGVGQRWAGAGLGGLGLGFRAAVQGAWGWGVLGARGARARGRWSRGRAEWRGRAADQDGGPRDSSDGETPQGQGTKAPPPPLPPVQSGHVSSIPGC
jgi:hypothetical protein